MKTRYRTSEDVKHLRNEIEYLKERYAIIENVPDTELMLCNIGDCRHGYDSEEDGRELRNVRGCVFIKGCNSIKKRSDCVNWDKDIEKSLVSLRDLRQSLETESEW